MKLFAFAMTAATLLAGTAAQAADYAPLDCAKAAKPSETAICKTYALGQDEARMATLFSVATSLVAMGRRGDLMDSQREWIASRDACGGDTSCLVKAYAARIAQLNAVISDIASRGPY
jgi:uncharacterized protein